MIRRLLLITSLACATYASAQIAEVGKPVQITPSAARQLAPRTTTDNIVIDADNVILSLPGSESVRIHPVSCAGYAWASLSPDGSHLMFVAAGNGLYITDLAGNVQAILPQLEFPVWVSDSVIAASVSTDDGHQYSSSQIILARADGSETQTVTAPESFTMEPQAAPDGSAIVYRTIDGLYYQASLTLK